MKKLVLTFVLVLVLGCASWAWAEDVERYKIYSAQIEKSKSKYEPITIMLDSLSGRTWYLSSSRIWYPMHIFSKSSKVKHDEIKSFGAGYAPIEGK